MLLILDHKLTPMRGSKQVEREHMREVVSRMIFLERAIERQEKKMDIFERKIESKIDLLIEKLQGNITPAGVSEKVILSRLFLNETKI